MIASVDDHLTPASVDFEVVVLSRELAGLDICNQRAATRNPALVPLAGC
jgi:hypothetical protein